MLADVRGCCGPRRRRSLRERWEDTVEPNLHPWLLVVALALWMIWRDRAPRSPRVPAQPWLPGVRCSLLAGSVRLARRVSRRPADRAPGCCCRCWPRSRCSTVFGWRVAARLAIPLAGCIYSGDPGLGRDPAAAAIDLACSRSRLLLRSRTFPRTSRTTRFEIPGRHFEDRRRLQRRAFLHRRARDRVAVRRSEP